MTCDHGISLDRYCGECEWDFTFDQDYPTHRQSRTATVVALLALAVFVGLYIAVKGGTPR